MSRSVLLVAVLAVACGGSTPDAKAPDNGGDGDTTTEVAAGNNSAADDRDEDGVPDDVDECPEIAETKNGIDDSDGCPEIDTDRDGIVGSADKCPADPEDVDGYEDEDGCPDVDGDKDGVADINDKCPEEMETINAYKDSDGCADEIPPPVKKFTGTISGIAFGSGSSNLLKSSRPTLDKAAKVMADYPDARFEIQGHTDDEGSRKTNVKLSQKRAESVRAYLIKKGVAKDRLVAKGYGPDEPIADNDTESGRAENRRVEFKLIGDAK